MATRKLSELPWGVLLTVLMKKLNIEAIELSPADVEAAEPHDLEVTNTDAFNGEGGVLRLTLAPVEDPEDRLNRYEVRVLHDAMRGYDPVGKYDTVTLAEEAMKKHPKVPGTRLGLFDHVQGRFIQGE